MNKQPQTNDRYIVLRGEWWRSKFDSMVLLPTIIWHGNGISFRFLKCWIELSIRNTYSHPIHD